MLKCKQLIYVNYALLVILLVYLNLMWDSREVDVFIWKVLDLRRHVCFVYSWPRFDPPRGVMFTN